jgi:hypothetical protein
MSAADAFQIIKHELNSKIDYEHKLKENNSALWLVRESNKPSSQPVLAIDYVLFANNICRYSSTRFLLSKKGWICAANLENAKTEENLDSLKSHDLEKLTQQMFKLSKVIAEATTKDGVNFKAQYRINPEKEMQTKNELFMLCTSTL